MSDPSTRGGPDPAVAKFYEHIERLKATEERLSALVSAARAKSDATPTTGQTSTPGVDPPAASPHASRRRWRQRTD